MESKQHQGTLIRASEFEVRTLELMRMCPPELQQDVYNHLQLIVASLMKNHPANVVALPSRRK